MLEKMSRFSSRFPWLVLIVVGAVTAFMAQQIIYKAYFETDLIKFLPLDLPAVKSDDYSKKNFNTQDVMLIGIEKEDGSVLDPDALRLMEKVILMLENMQAEKTFFSHLKGVNVTIKHSLGIDTDSINSIANLEDPILDAETGSVVTGSVIEKFKKDLNISFSPGEEERLPASDADLLRIVPLLKERVVKDRSYRGSLMSNDFKAATIQVSMHRKYIYKKRYATAELAAAIDSNLFKARFQGKDSTFPFEVYGKTINGVTLDDAYIEGHSKELSNKLQAFLNSELQNSFAKEPELKAILEQEMSPQSLQAVLQYIERDDFFLNPEIGTWRNFVDSLYEFTLETIDPFSRENLEFQIHNVTDMINIAQIYNLTQQFLNENKVEGINSYVAGNPVVEGVLSEMMASDMGRLIPIAIVVVLVILILSFRSFRGVIIPLVTVILTVIWSLGLMALLKIPFTVSTTGLPIVILAVGTAYSIHLLNRYYEDCQNSRDRFAIIQTSVRNVGGPIFMAAITTVAGFSSLSTTSLTTIQEFGQFSAVGVMIALFLSLTLTPAMLILWPYPKRNPLVKASGTKNGGILSIILETVSKLVVSRPKTILITLGSIMLGSAVLMPLNYFEGSNLSDFKEESVIFQSDKFLNKNLTGTTDINLIFRFRDDINLENKEIQQDLKERIALTVQSLDSYSSINNELYQNLLTDLSSELVTVSEQLPDSGDRLLGQVTLLKDILNEEYAVEVEVEEEITNDESDLSSLFEEEDTSGSDLGGDDLATLADGDDTGLEGLSDGFGLSEDSDDEQVLFSGLSSEQVEGLKTINQRLGKTDEEWEATGQQVQQLRSMKESVNGIQLQKQLNLLADVLELDVKQPRVLHKLEKLYHTIKNLDNPPVTIDGKVYKPSGLIITPVDYVRKFYKVFYHDDNPAFDRLPNVETDGFTDKTLTDRSIIGVVLNQALNADRDSFESNISPNLKQFQVTIMIRDGSTLIVDEYASKVMDLIREEFPENDPYIASIQTGGGAFTSVQISNLIGSSQMRSIALSFIFVFPVTFFIFRSLTGGLLSLIPLLFTVILNFGLLALLGGKITMVTMLVASVSVGVGVDYTIHVLERLKIQLRQGDSLKQAYINMARTSGKAVLVNATAVAAGFLVFLFSSFQSQIMLGLLVSVTMVFSSIGALVLLPAIILIVNPTFLKKVRPDYQKEASVNAMAN